MTENSIGWGKSEMHFPGWRSRGEVWRTEWKWKIYASVIITNTAWECDVRRRGIWASDLSSGSEQLFAARAQAFLESETIKPSFEARPSTRRQKTHQKICRGTWCRNRCRGSGVARISAQILAATLLARQLQQQCHVQLAKENGRRPLPRHPLCSLLFLRKATSAFW